MRTDDEGCAETWQGDFVRRLSLQQETVLELLRHAADLWLLIVACNFQIKNDRVSQIAFKHSDWHRFRLKTESLVEHTKL